MMQVRNMDGVHIQYPTRIYEKSGVVSYYVWASA